MRQQQQATDRADDGAPLGAARQFIETSRWFGVDFVPVRRDRLPADPGAATPGFVEPKDGAGRAGASAGGAEPSGRLPGLGRPPASRGVIDKAAALAELRERYERESEVARRIEGWTNIVFADGSPDARLMFVGEAPGADEDQAGVPFVGRAGQKLNEMIGAMGLERASVYIANVLKVRPPNNRTPTPEEAMLDGPFLLEQIRIVRPEVIVTLGRPATGYLLGTTEALGKLRGQWAEFEGLPVMPTYHPAFLLRQYTPENRKKVWSDLLRVMERLGLK